MSQEDATQPVPRTLSSVGRTGSAPLSLGRGKIGQTLQDFGPVLPDLEG